MVVVQLDWSSELVAVVVASVAGAVKVRLSDCMFANF
jgi:hypothetical protein